MAKYNALVLKIDNNEITNFESLNQSQRKLLDKGNVIYIYKSTKSKKVYIGQTKNLLIRHKQHYSGIEEKFNKVEFNKVIILTSRYFNRSALDDVEKQLITYFIADSQKSKSKVDFEYADIINGTLGNQVNDYKDSETIASEVLLPFWETVLYPEWVNTPTLSELRTKELVRYSPIKKLTEQQDNLINEILCNSNSNYVINGDAGTGKTVMLTHLVASFLNRTDKRIAIIVQPNWIQTAKKIFSVYKMNCTNLTIATSTTFINQKEKYDVIIVDESHKLSRRGSKQMASFNNIYEYKDFSDFHNHLEPLIDLSDQLILMYDVLQAIRPANISRESFRLLTKDFEQRYLTTQFRIQPSKDKTYTSEDYINGIKHLLYKDTDLLNYTSFDPNFDRSIFHDEDPDAYFGYFDDMPLKNLINWVEEDCNYNPEHVNRVLAGLVEPWAQKDGKDPSITHFHEGNIHRRWNSTQENWINSQDKDAEDQIGSVFAVQGIDLNKVGVLIGGDIQTDQDGKLYGDPTHFHNVNGKFSKEDFMNLKNKQEFTIFVLNIYYVLLTRGIDGIRIGFWNNENFRQYFKNTISELKSN